MLEVVQNYTLQIIAGMKSRKLSHSTKTLRHEVFRVLWIAHGQTEFLLSPVTSNPRKSLNKCLFMSYAVISVDLQAAGNLWASCKLQSPQCQHGNSATTSPPLPCAALLQLVVGLLQCRHTGLELKLHRTLACHDRMATSHVSAAE